MKTDWEKSYKDLRAWVFTIDVGCENCAFCVNEKCTLDECDWVLDKKYLPELIKVKEVFPEEEYPKLEEHIGRTLAKLRENFEEED